MLRYQQEPTELRDLAWQQGHLSAWQFLRICSWKSAKGLASLCLNRESEIEIRTAAACHHLAWAKDLDVIRSKIDWEAWEQSVRSAVGDSGKGTGLLGLQGVGYPVATAVLCILNPAAFPVLDRWAVLDLYGAATRRMGYYSHADRYREYTERLVERGAARGSVTVHDLDKEAMDRARMSRTST